MLFSLKLESFDSHIQGRRSATKAIGIKLSETRDTMETTLGFCECLGCDALAQIGYLPAAVIVHVSLSSSAGIEFTSHSKLDARPQKWPFCGGK